MKIKIKKLVDHAVIPEYKTRGAACFDLTATEIVYDEPGKARVKFGLAVEIPEGYKICIAPRSSRTLKGWVQINTPGQVDSDYRGELMWFLDAIPNGVDEKDTSGFISRYYELEYPELNIKVGERCAQAWVEKVIQAEWEEVEELSETERGVGGFGHTGK